MDKRRNQSPRLCLHRPQARRAGPRLVRWGLPAVILASTAYAQPAADPQGNALLTKDALRRLSATDQAALDILGRDAQTGRLMVRGARRLLERLKDPGVFLRADDSIWETPQDVQGYMTPDDVVAGLTDLAGRHPQFMRLETIGTTREGRPIMAVVIEEGADRPERQGEDAPWKPTVFFDGMHHAREVMTVEVVFDIVQSFAAALEGKTSDPELVQWAHDYRIVVAPQMNPDGNALVHGGQNLWRKNAWQLKGKTVGVDLNRNYPAYWGTCNGSSGQTRSDTYRGPSAGSEPETQALMKTVASYRPAMAISYHSFSELIIFPYGCDDVTNPSRDVFVSLAQSMNAAIKNDRGQTKGYDVGTAPELLYNADGSDLDWQWDTYGVYAYTIEINSSLRGFQPNYAAWRDVTVSNQAGGWRSLVRNLAGPGISGQLDLGTDAYENANSWLERSFTIEMLADKGTSQSSWMPFATHADGHKHFPLRDRSGQFFQPLKTGTYRLSFWHKDVMIAQRQVAVGATRVDLGTVTAGSRAK